MLDIDRFIDDNFDRLCDDLKEIIAVPSVARYDEEGYPFGRHCAKVLELFLKKAEDFGFVTKNFDNYAGTISFDETEPKLGILCHLDVVAADEKSWTSPPFEPEIREGRLFGRGAIDDKGPAMAVLYAMKYIKEAGIDLKHNVRFIVGCNEENGSSDMEYYRKQEDFPEMCFTPDGNYPCINFEKGMIRLGFSLPLGETEVCGIRGGNVINAVPDKAAVIFKDGSEKKRAGRAAHASTPDLGENALTSLVSDLARQDRSEAWKKVTGLFPAGDNHGRALGIYSSDEETGDVTCVWSCASIEEGRLFGKVDIRYPNNISLSEMKKKISSVFEENNISYEFILAEEPHYVSPESELVKKLLSVYSEETGTEAKPLAIGGGTYVHDIEGGVAFGAEFPGEDNRMHGNDEFIKLESLRMDLKLFIKAIISLCS